MSLSEDLYFTKEEEEIDQMSISENPETLDSIEEKKEEKTDFPTEIMKIVQKYTSWRTMEDLYKEQEKYEISWGTMDKMYSEPCKFDVKDIEKERESMDKLLADLKDYKRDCKKSLHDLVEITKHQIFDKFQGIQNMEAHNELDDDDWIDAILLERRSVNHRVGNDCQCCDCWLNWPKFNLASLAYDQPLYRKCTLPVVDTNDGVEIRIKDLYEELETNRSKVLEAKDLCMTSRTVCHTVESVIIALENTVRHREYQIESEKRQMEFEKEKCESDRISKEKEQEARKLMKEKWQCLCNVMKEVLGDRVEDVAVSSGYSCSSCIMRHSDSTDAKIMEINPHDHIIKELQERVDADKNDFHVRSAALVLFNYAELSMKSRIKQF